MTDTLGFSAAVVLPDDRRDGEAQRDNGKKERLHDACADPEAGLGCGTEVPDDCVDDENVDGEERKLRARRDADLEHRPPDLHLRLPLRDSEPKVMKFLFEIEHR